MKSTIIFLFLVINITLESKAQYQDMIIGKDTILLNVDYVTIEYNRDKTQGIYVSNKGIDSIISYPLYIIRDTILNTKKYIGKSMCENEFGDPVFCGFNNYSDTVLTANLYLGSIPKDELRKILNGNFIVGDYKTSFSNSIIEYVWISDSLKTTIVNSEGNHAVLQELSNLTHGDYFGILKLDSGNENISVSPWEIIFTRGIYWQIK